MLLARTEMVHLVAHAILAILETEPIVKISTNAILGMSVTQMQIAQTAHSAPRGGKKSFFTILRYVLKWVIVKLDRKCDSTQKK